MGYIQRQAIKNNLIAYLSLGVGAVAQVFVYPLDLELKGFADALVKYATLLYPFATLGVGSVMVRYVSHLDVPPERARRQLFARLMLVVLAFLAVIGVLLLLLGDRVVALALARGWQLGVLLEYPWTVYALTVSLALAALLTTNLANYNRVAIPVAFNSLLIKVGLPVLVLLVVYDYVTLPLFVGGLVGLYAVATLGLLVYSRLIGAARVDLSPLAAPRPLRREMADMALFSIFGLIGSSLVTSIDVVVINNFQTDRATAIFTFGLFVAATMKIPAKAINMISLSKVSALLQARDHAALRSLYRDSATVLLVAGLLLYGGMVLCLPYFYQLTSGTLQYAPGYLVVVFLGLGMLFDLVTSINGSIINYSDDYRWNVGFVLFAGLLNFALNYLAIVVLDLGITGAAASSAVSLLLYNAIKVGFVHRRIGIHPFTGRQLVIVLLNLLLWAVIYPVPDLAPAPVMLVLKGGALVVASALVYGLTPLVPSVRELLRAVPGRFRKPRT